ncbi:hypothetical protein AGMMS50276_02700 [Synergistales bacterium]|nr:hypothetical protein AGMMS50276_02700 [Synergistales bacterium]
MRSIINPKKSIFQFFLCVAVLCMGLSFAVSAFAAVGEENLIERAKNLYGVQEYSVAKILFEKIIASDPENGEAWDYASWCERYLGNWEKAEEGFRKAKSLLPGELSKWVEVGLGETYFGASVFEKSIESFTRAIELAPDDEELIIRALKGLAFAYASLGDSVKVDEILARLAEKNLEEAEIVRGDAAVIIKAHKPEVVAESKSEEEEQSGLSNTMERQSDVAERAAPDQGSEKDDFTSIWSLKIGAPIEDALESLKSQGIDFVALEEATALGSRFYVTKLPNDQPLLDWVDKNVGSSFHFLEEYQGKLLRVTAGSVWTRSKGSIAFKDEIFDSMLNALSEQYGKYSDIDGNGLYAEAVWIPEWNHLVNLEMTVSLDGKVYLSLTHGHLPGLFEFWKNAKIALGKNR